MNSESDNRDLLRSSLGLGWLINNDYRIASNASNVILFCVAVFWLFIKLMASIDNEIDFFFATSVHELSHQIHIHEIASNE